MLRAVPLAYMKQVKLVHLALLAISFSLVSCAPKAQRSPISPQNQSTAVDDVRRIQAEQTTVIASIRNDIRSLVGRLEEIEFQLQKDDGKTPLARGKIEAAPEGIPSQELAEDEKYAASITNDEARLFTIALSKIRSAQFFEARQLLDRVLDSSAGAEWTVNVMFWIGVVNEKIGNLEKALGAYHECASTYQQHRLAPLALIRQASIFEKLNDMTSAKLALSKVTTKYADTPYAAQAQSKLSTL